MEHLQHVLPAAKFVKAFNSVGAALMVAPSFPGGAKPSMFYCGDDAGAKKVAAGLIRDVGFDPLDAGPLWVARFTEPFALLVGELAYEGKGGPELVYRFERYGR